MTKTRSHAVSSKPGIQTSAAKKESTALADPMTLLFRREVQSMLTIAPPNVDPDQPVRVLAAIERLSLSGTQQSLQLCEAGTERWVTRTEGDRTYFPRLGRVNKHQPKRLREDDIEEEVEVKNEDTPILETPRSSKKAKSSKMEPPPAPRRARRAPSHPPTETSVGSAESIRKHVEEALSRGKGKRRCVGRDSEERAFVLKSEPDELESLCGRVDGLDVQSLASLSVGALSVSICS